METLATTFRLVVTPAAQALTKQAAVRRPITKMDLDQAKLDQTKSLKFKRELKGPPVTAEERQLIRRLATETFETLVRTKPNLKKVTLESWFTNLMSIFSTRTPEVREELLNALRTRYTESEEQSPGKGRPKVHLPSLLLGGALGVASAEPIKKGLSTMAGVGREISRTI